jgi:hypothetical protein
VNAILVGLTALWVLAAGESAAQLRPPRDTQSWDHYDATAPERLTGSALQAPAYDATATAGLTGSALQAAASEQRRAASPPEPDDVRWRNRAMIAGGVALVAAYGLNQWWSDGFGRNFRTENEGWFGRHTESGGADKLGHAFFSYAGARLLARGFEAIGNDPQRSSKLGFWSALAVMTAVEVADGYSHKYRFSTQDALMNVAGAGLGYLLERNPALDRLLDIRLLYKPSPGSGFDPGGDYSGQTYLVVFKASGVDALRAHEPARYLELALGYGTRGFDDPPGSARSRNLYVGISLDVSELLRRTVFRGSGKSIAQRSSEMLFEFIQVPGTAALYRHRL